jgi:hypothetical protein
MVLIHRLLEGVRMGRILKQLKLNRLHRGQGIVEFALALPIFLTLVVGVFEVARMLMAYISAYSSAREATRYAASIGAAANGEPRYRDCVGIREAAKRGGFLAGIEDANILIRYDPGPVDTEFVDLPACPQEVLMGDRVLVRVTVNYEPLFGLIPGLKGFSMTTTNARTIVKDLDVRGTPGPSPTPRNTRTPTPGPSLTPSLTKTLKPTATTTLSPTTTVSPTITLTPTETLTPTVTRTVTLTPTETSTPTETPTPTYCPPEICEPTPTPKNTHTPTITLTPSNTPTNTPLPTITPDCSQLSLGAITHTSFKKDYISVSNTGSATATIQKISVNWDQSDALTTILFGSSTIWVGRLQYVANITTFAPSAVLTLVGNYSKDLVLTFTNSNYSINSISVYWTNGCVSTRSQ